MLKQVSSEELLGRPLSDDQRGELLALMDRPDAEIDTSDIPEVRGIPAGAVRGRFPLSRGVGLSEEHYGYFRAAAERKGVSLNVLINDILSKEIEIIEAVR